MTRAERSLFFFGIYLTGVGVVLLLIPNVLLWIFSIPTTSEVWIRVLGAVLIPVSFYYIEGTRSGATWLVRLSVWGRAFVALCLFAFVGLGLVHWPLVLFGLVDLGAAAWTGFELRREGVPLSPIAAERA